MKKKMIINIVLVVCIIVGIFFIVKYDVLGVINKGIFGMRDKWANQGESVELHWEGEIVYEKSIDKDGNEILMKMQKVVAQDPETGEEVIITESLAPKTIYDNYYEGKIEKIEGSNIFYLRW